MPRRKKQLAEQIILKLREIEVEVGRSKAITEAMRAKTDESPAIKSKIDDVAEAVVAVKRDLIGELPKMRRSGRTDVSDLKVSINALTPVSEPLYAVA